MSIVDFVRKVAGENTWDAELREMLQREGLATD